MARRSKQKTDAPRPNRAAIYMRVSTEEQAQGGLGLGAQRQRCEAMATAKGWEVGEIYADEGISGTRGPAQRPALARLLADCEAGQYCAVIILSLDRLGRSVLLLLDLVEQLGKYRVDLVSCKETLDTSTPTGKFIFTTLAAMAQLERDLTAERTAAALDERARTTGDRGGRVPLGYMRTDGEIEVDTKRVGTVRLIFKLRDDGLTLRQIAEVLNRREVAPPRGGREWYAASVRDVLQNEATYRGGPRADSLVSWPPILN